MSSTFYWKLTLNKKPNQVLLLLLTNQMIEFIIFKIKGLCQQDYMNDAGWNDMVAEFSQGISSTYIGR